MSDQEVELWEGVFRCAVSRATSCSISLTAFVEDFLQELHQDKVQVYVQDAAMFFVVLTYWEQVHKQATIAPLYHLAYCPYRPR